MSALRSPLPAPGGGPAASPEGRGLGRERGRSGTLGFPGSARAAPGSGGFGRLEPDLLSAWPPWAVPATVPDASPHSQLGPRAPGSSLLRPGPGAAGEKALLSLGEAVSVRTGGWEGAGQASEPRAPKVKALVFARGSVSPPHPMTLFHPVTLFGARTSRWGRLRLHPEDAPPLSTALQILGDSRRSAGEGEDNGLWGGGGRRRGFGARSPRLAAPQPR